MSWLVPDLTMGKEVADVCSCQLVNSLGARSPPRASWRAHYGFRIAPSGAQIPSTHGCSSMLPVLSSVSPRA